MAQPFSAEDIKEAALELFSDKGYHAASMREIALKAGISLGLSYNYFKSKEDILRGLLDDHLDSLENLAAGIKKGNSPDCASLYKFIKKESRSIRLLWSVIFFPGMLGENSVDLRIHIARRQKNLDSVLKKIFTEHDSGTVRSFFLGLVIHTVSFPDQFTGKEFCRQIQHFFLDTHRN
jgi:AcrR family transcriptional regulator